MNDLLRWVWVSIMAVSAIGIIPIGSEYIITSPYPAARALQTAVVLMFSVTCFFHIYYYAPTYSSKSANHKGEA